MLDRANRRVQQKQRDRQLWISFFVCGLLNNFPYVVMLSAAHHIVESSAGAVLLADILPTLTIKLCAPWFMHRLPYTLRICFFVSMGVFAFILVAAGQSTFLKLLGVICASISAGGGEITFLALTAHFPSFTVSAWSSGTGGAGVLGAFSYLCLTTWIGLSPPMALGLVAPSSILISWAYFEGIQFDESGVCEQERVSSLTKDLTTGAFELDDLDFRDDHSSEGGHDETLLSADADADSDMGGAVRDDRALDVESHSPGASGPSTTEEAGGSNSRGLTKQQMTEQLYWLLPRYMAPLFVVYWAEYTINQGIDPALVFKGQMSAEDLYRYYQFLYQIGVFISRSSVKVYPIRRIWIPSILQLANFVILFIVTMAGPKHVFGHFIVAFAFILWEGLLGGATYVNAFYRISVEVDDPVLREYSMGVTSVADTFGISLAALTSIFLEPYLKARAKIS